MKRVFILLFAAAAVGCAQEKQQIVINDIEPKEDALNMSFELAYAAVDAQNYEDFKKARVELEKYEEAFRDQAGGEAYITYLKECNAILSEL